MELKCKGLTNVGTVNIANETENELIDDVKYVRGGGNYY